MQSQTPPAFTLPAALLRDGYALRPETDADIPFLKRLYASTREDELAQTGWPDAQKHAFLEHQFAAQRSHYRTYIAGCAFDLLEHNGEPVGRLYLEERAARLHIVDIALMPQSRGSGLGTAILQGVIDAARAQGKAVGIFVETFNPALRLYQRLGFRQFGEQGVYLEMEWRDGVS